jgi:hypothetical protein
VGIENFVEGSGQNLALKDEQNLVRNSGKARAVLFSEIILGKNKSKLIIRSRDFDSPEQGKVRKQGEIKRKTCLIIAGSVFLVYLKKKKRIILLG